MILIDEASTIPQDVWENLGSYAKEELKDAGNWAPVVDAASERKWAVYNDGRPVLAMGVVRPASLLGVYQFWFLLCDGVTLADMKFMKRQLRIEMAKYYHYVQTYIEVGYKEGERFARWLGFTARGDTVEVMGRNYNVYETRR